MPGSTLNEILVPRMTNEQTLRREHPSQAAQGFERISLPPNVTLGEFREVVSAAYLAYIGGPTGKQATKGTGAPPEPKEVHAYLPEHYTLDRVSVIMGTSAFRQACQARGISISSKPGLTSEQEYALSILLDPTAGRSLSQRLRKAGISKAKYDAWKRNPVFRGHLANMGQRILKDYEDDMMVTLAGSATEGDLNAIKFAFEVSGRHDPNARSVMDARQLMVQFVEIVKTHVKDPETLAAIGREFVLLASQSGAVEPTGPDYGSPLLSTPPLEIEE